MKTTRRLLCWLLAWLLAGAAAARTLEGVSLPEEMAVAGRTLVLNGAGVREKFFFDIYVAALYLPRRSADAGRILASGEPWRMVMHFLYRKVARGKLADAWEEGFAANLPPERLAYLRPRLDRFKSLFPDLKRGQEVVLDHLPGEGVRVYLDGRELGRIDGDDFAAALLSVWLGERPVTDSLKAALLGTEG